MAIWRRYCIISMPAMPSYCFTIIYDAGTFLLRQPFAFHRIGRHLASSMSPRQLHGDVAGPAPPIYMPPRPVAVLLGRAEAGDMATAEYMPYSKSAGPAEPRLSHQSRHSMRDDAAAGRSMTLAFHTDGISAAVAIAISRTRVRRSFQEVNNDSVVRRYSMPNYGSRRARKPAHMRAPMRRYCHARRNALAPRDAAGLRQSAVARAIDHCVSMIIFVDMDGFHHELQRWSRKARCLRAACF